MSMIKFSASFENISSNGGFSFVSGILDSISGMSLWDRLLAVHCNTRFSHQTIVRSAIGLMTAGCCDFADIEKFCGDAMFRHLVGQDIPSQETFRQRMNLLSETSWTPVVDGIVAELLRKASLGRISMHGTDYIPIDIDVAVMEDTSSNKEGVAMSYHQVKGYAPIFCYAGTQGYMVADEMRPGNQHCEKGAVEFLRRCVGIILKAGHKASELLLRVDSGHDSADFIKAAEALGEGRLGGEKALGRVGEVLSLDQGLEHDDIPFIHRNVSFLRSVQRPLRAGASATGAAPAAPVLPRKATGALTGP